MPRKPKYHVFKATDSGDVGEMVHDAVVIRRQDVFAPPALDAYANAILTAVELLDTIDDEPRVKALRDIADFFHEQAQLAWHTDRKIPD